MTILLNTARHRFIFPYHTCYVSNACYFASNRIRKDNLIGYLFFTILHGFYVDRNLLVIVVDATAHGCDTLGLQTTKQHLLTDSVCL